MKTLRTDAAIELCRRYEQSGPSADPAIQAVLVAHAAVTAYAEIEAEIRTVLRERVLAETSGGIPDYARYSVERLVRSIKISDLSNACKWFGDKAVEDFKRDLTDEAKNSWDSLLTTRHSAAHEADVEVSAATITLADIERYLRHCRVVFDSFKRAVSKPTTVEPPAEKLPAVQPALRAGDLG